MFDVIGILYAPGEFIRRNLKARLSYRVPFGIVVVAALGGLLANLLAGDKWFARLSDQIHEYPSIEREMEAPLKSVKVGFMLQNVFGALEPPLLWILGTGILTCMAILLEGEGEFRKLLELTGYSYLAPMVFSLVAILFALTWKPHFTLDGLPDPKARPEIFRDEVKRAIQKEVGSTNFRYLMFLKWASIGWMVVLQTMALKATSKLSLGKSVACVAAFGVLYGISQLVRSLASAGGI